MPALSLTNCMKVSLVNAWLHKTNILECLIVLSHLWFGNQYFFTSGNAISWSSPEDVFALLPLFFKITFIPYSDI